MQKQYIFNRRTLLGAAAATTTVGLLAACGGSKKEDKVKAPGKTLSLRNCTISIRIRCLT